MQAIHTKYVGATDRRGSHIRAKCDQGSIKVNYNSNLSAGENHKVAAKALADKYNLFSIGSEIRLKMVSGELPGNMGYAHVLVYL